MKRETKDKGVAGGTAGSRESKAASRRSTASRLRDAVVSLDAEDIALARLQAHLRQAEAIHPGTGSGPASLRRTTVRLPMALLARLRARAKREGTTASEVVEKAVERFLRSR